MINGRSKIRKPKPATSPPPPNGKALMSIMARKSSILKQTLATFLVALIIYGLFSAFLNRTETSKLDSSFPLSSTTTASVVLNEVTSPRNFRSVNKVRIYMYDLPKRFTFGVIQHHSLARGGKPVDDVTGLKYPGHQHMAEWYLFKDLDLMKPDSDRVDSSVVRVMDAEEADLFYVPFFSSLSLIVNPIRPDTEMTERPVYTDDENQVALVEWLEEQQYWKRNNGRDHVIIAQDPNALYKVIDRLKNSVLLVSDFGRLRPQQASLVKDIILPYSHRINTYTGDVGIENRPTLLFFMGNRYRKEGGKIRDILFQILENDIDVIIKHGTQSRESRRAASHGMHTSKFCLNPAGDTPSACRLFDSIVSLCVPVIISNSIELPFEDVVDYRKIAIFVDSEAAIKPGYLLKMLHAIRPERILEYQRELKEVKRYFEYEETDGTVNQIWRQVSQKLPLIKLMVNRDKRLLGKDLDCSCICSNKTEIRTSL